MAGRVTLGLLAAGVVASAGLAPGEFAAERDGRAIDAGTCAETGDGRLLGLCAAAAGERAIAAGGPARAAALALARDDAGRLVALDPRDGAALALSAWLAAIAGDDAAAVARLRDSYRFAPYLRDQGYWRLWYGAGHWGALRPGDRVAVLREAVWLQRLGPREARAVAAAVTGTPAYVPVILRAAGGAGERLGPPA